MPSLKFNSHDSVIVVEAKIGGTKRVATVRLVFDTGASLVILPWKLTTGLGLKVDQTKITQTTTAPTVEPVPLIIYSEDERSWRRS